MHAALELAADLLGQSHPVELGDEALPSHLTAREQEVARLVASGSTNRQIAETLVISPGTARTHVEHIRSKLGVASRTAIAAAYSLSQH
jgi:DNA-binding NarL/FixJ family response regulator